MSKRSKDELETMKTVAGVMFAVVTVLTDAVRGLGGTFEHIRRLTTPEGAETVKAIAALIANDNKKVFPIWRTVKLGLHKNADEYCRALHVADFYIGIFANNILGRITFSVAEREVDLIVRSVAELGFANGATFAQICDAAKKLGLSLCPAEVGPALREQYRDQPMNEWLVIAMEPITDSDSDLGVFDVARDGDGLELGCCFVNPESVWFADGRFVFASGK